MSPLPKRSLPNPDFKYVRFKGGLDLVTPVYSVEPGTVRDAENYEIGINSGYGTVVGYERFDGQARPSDGSYSIYDVTITGSFSVGDTITGVTSTETAVVVAVVTSETPNYLVITKISGAFTSGEVLNVSGSPEGTAIDIPVADGAATAQLHGQYLNLAADEYRSDILAVPGSGDVFGFMQLNDVKFAFRNDGGGDVDLFKNTASGWSQVPLGFELAFTSGGGAYEFKVGDTITGATSTFTAVITGLTIESGTLAGGDATGRIIYLSSTGAFVAENLNVGANLDVATIAADGTAITITAGSGQVRKIRHNFGGQLGTKKLYGCDSVNRGFEFDGTTYIPVATPFVPDTPVQVIAHEKHLHFAFGSSTANSAIGDPLNWEVINGAAEIATGDDITGYKTLPGNESGGALLITAKDTHNILYGNDKATWDLVQFEDEVGAYADTIQRIAGRTIFADERFISDLYTVQAYGNFKHKALSDLFLPWYLERKTTITGSCVVRDKNQYRLFFSSGAAAFITMEGNKIMGMMPILMPDHVVCVDSSEANDGTEEIYFGSDDGFVYQMEKGTSFDGDEINTRLAVHFYNAGTPRVQKRYYGGTFETSGEGYSEFNFTYELGYASTLKAQPGTTAQILPFRSVFWDAFVWDAFVWDGQTLAPANLKIKGRAENVSIITSSVSDYFNPILFSGVLIRQDITKTLRG